MTDHSARSNTVNADGHHVNVSVVIPVFQAFNELRMSLTSVYNQTFSPLEVILVFDGESPYCFLNETVKEFKVRNIDVRILLNGENRGAGYSRLKGFHLCRGKYISLLDADDYWHPTKLEIQFSIMETEGLNFSFHNYTQNIKPSDLRQFVSDPNELVELSRLPPRCLVLGNIISTPTVMMRNVPENSPPTMARRCDDFAWWIKLAFADNVVNHIDNNLACGFKPAIGHSGLTRSLLLMHLSTLYVLILSARFSGASFFLQSLIVEVLKFPPRYAMKWGRSFLGNWSFR